MRDESPPPPARSDTPQRGFGPRPPQNTQRAWVRESAPPIRGHSNRAPPARLSRLPGSIELPAPAQRSIRRAARPRPQPRRKHVSESEEEPQQSEEEPQAEDSSQEEHGTEEEKEADGESEEPEDRENQEDEDSEQEDSEQEEDHSEGDLQTEEDDLHEKALRQKQRLQKALQPVRPPAKPTRLSQVPRQQSPVSFDFTAVTPQPFELCCKEEADRRQLTRALSIYEMQANSDAVGVERPDYKPAWVVKEYTRSAAGLDQSGDVRHSAVLSRTLDYLFTNILDVDKSNPNGYSHPPHSSAHRFIDIYRFISNRARAVTKDYKIAGETKSPNYVRDLERIARFHILAAAEGLDYSKMEDESLRFEDALNFKRLENILISLEEAYKQVPGDHPQEGEFIAYKIIMRIDNQRLVQKWLKDTPSRLRQHPLLVLAEKVVRHYHGNNYFAFFQLVPQAPFLLAALMTMSFDKVRLQAIKAIQLSYHDSERLTLAALAKWLGFADAEEAEEYLVFRGADVDESGVRLKNLELSEEKFIFSAAPANVIAKMPPLRWSVVHEVSQFTPPAEPAPVPKPAPVIKPVPALKPTPVPEPKLTEAPKPTVDRAEGVAARMLPQFSPSPQLSNKTIEPTLTIEVPKPPPQREQPAFTLHKPRPNEFRFPTNDSDFLDIASSREEQAEMKSSIRTYRKDVRVKAKRAAEKQRLTRLFFLFCHIKAAVQLKHVKVEVEQEMENSTKKFRKAISTRVIDDFLFTKDSASRPAPQAPHTYCESLLRALAEAGHRFFKVSILSYGVAPLDELLEHSLFASADGLKTAGIWLNSDVANLAGSDVVVLMVTEGELGTVNFQLLPCCALFVLWVSEARGVCEEDLVRELGFDRSHFLTIDMFTVDPLYLRTASSTDTRLHDLFLHPLARLIRESVPRVISALRLTRIRDLPFYYEQGLEQISAPLKEKLLRLSLAAGNAWVQVVNALHVAVLSKLDTLYATVLPSPELLAELGVHDFEKTLKDYKPLRCVIDRFQLEFLPTADDFIFTREEAEAFLLDYAFGAVSICEELIPASSTALLYELQRIFCESPVQVTPSGLQAPWNDFFLSLLTHQLLCLSQFAGKVYMEAAPLTIEECSVLPDSQLSLETLNDVVRERYHVDYYKPTRTLFPDLSTAFKRQRVEPKEQQSKPPPEPELVKQVRTNDTMVRRKAPDLAGELRKSRLQRQEVSQMLAAYGSR